MGEVIDARLQFEARRIMATVVDDTPRPYSDEPLGLFVRAVDDVVARDPEAIHRAIGHITSFDSIAAYLESLEQKP